MESCNETLEAIFDSFKPKKGNNTVEFTDKELNLIKIIVGEFLKDVKHKDKHNTGDDISDYMRESLQDIEGIYNKVINYKAHM